MAASDKQMDIAEIRARLAVSQGKEYWRSLEELAESEAFQESLRREFPSGAGILIALTMGDYLTRGWQ